MPPLKIAIIDGDGIGPDLFEQVDIVIQTINRRFDTDIQTTHFPYSADYYLKSGISIPDEFITEMAQNYNAIFLGPLGDPRITEMKHAQEMIRKLRTRLSLSMSVQPIKLFQNWMTTQKDFESKSVDYLIIKEIFESSTTTSEQLYNPDKESALALQSSILTYKNIRNFIKDCFQYLTKTGRNRICFVEQGLKYRQSQIMWNNAISEEKEKYPELTITNKYITTAVRDILSEPDEYDAFVSVGEIGDILSSISSVIFGGYGLAYSVEANPDLINIYRIMQASSPKLAKSNTINPFGAIIAFQQILIDQGLNREANSISAAIMSNFSNHWITIDMGGIMGTEEVTNYICDHISNQ